MASTARKQDYIVQDLEREAQAAALLREHLIAVEQVDADDEQTINDTIEGETSLLETITRVVDRIGEFQAYAGVLKEQERKKALRRKGFEAAEDQLRGALALALEAAGLDKIKLAQATITRKKTAPTLIVSEEDEIPRAFWKIPDPTLDRTALLRALKDEMAKADADKSYVVQAIPGCSLSNGGMTVQIRF